MFSKENKLTNTIQLHMVEDKEISEILGSIYNSTVLHYIVGPLTQGLIDEVLEHIQGTDLVVLYSKADKGVDHSFMKSIIQRKLTHMNILLEGEDLVGIPSKDLTEEDIITMLDASILDGMLFPTPDGTFPC